MHKYTNIHTYIYICVLGGYLRRDLHALLEKELSNFSPRVPAAQCTWSDPSVTSFGPPTQQPTPVLLPGKSHGQRSLVGYNPWGHKQSDTTKRLDFFLLHSPHTPLKARGSRPEWFCPGLPPSSVWLPGRIGSAAAWPGLRAAWARLPGQGQGLEPHPCNLRTRPVCGRMSSSLPRNWGRVGGRDVLCRVNTGVRACGGTSQCSIG